METTNALKRIHPLMAAAAAAVIVASITAVAAMTGLLPATQGSVNEAMQSAAGEQTLPATAPARPAAPETKSVPHKTVARTASPARTHVAAAPVPPPAAAPAPGSIGTVESVREIAQQGEGTGLGAAAGGVLGAVLGHQLGNGRGQTVLTAAGAAGGAYAGHQVEKRARGTKRWEIAVRMGDDTLRTIATDTQPTWRTGDRVRLVSGTLQPG